MNPHDIASAAQDIVQQASTGPGEKGQVVKNTLSPHLERFACERIRKVLIGGAKDLETQVHNELNTLEKLFASGPCGELEVLAGVRARIAEHIRNLFKQ